MNINFKNPVPYSHAGRWPKTHPSLMNPGDTSTWPQLLVEWVVLNRIKLWKSYRGFRKGKGWSYQLGRQGHGMFQQATTLCNYFAHPDDEPLVAAAFRRVFDTQKVTVLGQHRKNRVNKTGGCTVTAAEKDLVRSIWLELEALKKRTNQASEVADKPRVTCEPSSRMTSGVGVGGGRFGALIEEEHRDG